MLTFFFFLVPPFLPLRVIALRCADTNFLFFGGNFSTLASLSRPIVFFLSGFDLCYVLAVPPELFFALCVPQ